MFIMMKRFGDKVVPLSVVGMFMNYTGNHLLHHIEEKYMMEYPKDARQVFFPRHEVVNITHLDNGMILTTAVKHTPGKEDEPPTFVQFKSKAIVLSNGAK